MQACTRLAVPEVRPFFNRDNVELRLSTCTQCVGPSVIFGLGRELILRAVNDEHPSSWGTDKRIESGLVRSRAEECESTAGAKRVRQD
jgi:hypothetical protein